MVATLIFLDRPLALTIWTHFRVGYNPIYVFRFVWVFDFPLSIHITIGRFMLLLSTFETEGIATKAVDYLRWIDDSLCRVITLLSEWTPFNQLIIICKRLAVPSHILFEYFLIFIIGASFVEKLRINGILTIKLHPTWRHVVLRLSTPVLLIRSLRCSYQHPVQN